MTITTKAAAKVAAVATGLAMATSMLSLAPIAHAATTTTTTTTTSCSVGTVNLTVGSSGAAVTCLQQGLIANGYAIAAGATGYFGAQTKAAVMKWQVAAGISPAVGYFGPISRSHWGTTSSSSTTTTSTVAGCAAGAMYSSTTGAMCTTTTTVAGCAPGAMFSSTTGQSCGSTTTTTTTTSGTLSGSGRLINVNSYGDLTSDIKVGAGATNVVGVSADAVGGDVAIQRVDASFYVDDVTSQSSGLDQYLSDISLYLDGVKLASMSPTMADKSGRIWTARFAGLNGVIKQGKTGNIVVKVTPISSIATTEDGKGIIAALLANSVRAVGADGISDTYVSGATVTQNSGTADSVTGTTGQKFTVSSRTTGTLTVTAGADNPKASQVAVSSSTTTGVKLLSFNLKAKNADSKITDLKAQFVTSAANLNDVVSNVKLMHGSTVVSTKTLSTGTAGFVTFTNIQQTVAKDATENYTILADLKGDSAYTDGTTLIASTTVTGWDVSDTSGASVTPSAAAVGNTMTLTATGISVVKGSVTTNTTTGLANGADTTQYVIPFTVTAGDNDVFVGTAKTKLATAATTPSASAGGVNYATTTSSTQGATGEPTASFSAADVVTGDTTGAFKVNAGTSRTFTFTAAISATTTGSVTAGYTGVQIVGINYGPTSTLGTTYYVSNLDTFKTNDVYMTKR